MGLKYGSFKVSTALTSILCYENTRNTILYVYILEKLTSMGTRENNLKNAQNCVILQLLNSYLFSFIIHPKRI